MVVVGADVRQDRCADDLDSVGVSTPNDLLVGGQNALYEESMVRICDFCSASEAAEIVDAFEDDEGVDARLGEDVAVEAGECVGAEAVDEEMVSADAVIKHADGVGFG